ncbi:hypothetical protein GLOTRDRAFT_50102 [Gloeophyllum trabeum ATCC 11539]|uniref:BTB domain-containing protein n=1 Tax=Gloeophyllum trabeum (strain ATCC 11539 / FP-39264 / Madison 617) TaxID=670483 RepID=S7PTQ9_GLOTA|nr:uncharacterized protein GLOTRDRAFT_50102 [Gloeophyllum trabeum ATCC 11539]EPQ50717.1 hypothetical protein GLOTRDRAFT_50102 [Gloeophyllum trabeum ATCC 11539]
MLCKVSPIFADMFALPPSDANEFCDGVPVVRMPDGAEELEALLMFLYHERSLHLTRLDPNTPALVRPVLSIATKYEIDTVRIHVVDRLMEDWPTRQKGWYDKHNTYIDDHLPEPASAIQLAKTFGIPAILPAAFYHLSRLSVGYGLDGSKSTRVQMAVLAAGMRTAKWKSLQADDYYSLLHGRTNLKASASSSILGWNPPHHELDSESDSPADADSDHEKLCSLEVRDKHYVDLRHAIYESDDALQVLKTRAEQGPFPRKLCWRCRNFARLQLAELRENLWKRLPKMFNIIFHPPSLQSRAMNWNWNEFILRDL